MFCDAIYRNLYPVLPLKPLGKGRREYKTLTKWIWSWLVLPWLLDAYRVIEDIQVYNRLDGLKKQQSDVATQIYTLNRFSVR